MSITIVNKKYFTGSCTSGDYGTPLGNRYTFLPIDNTKAKFTAQTRGEAIDMGYKDLCERIKNNEEELVKVIVDLIIRYRNKENIVLGCWCKPLVCHLDLVKNAIENGLFEFIPSVNLALKKKGLESKIY